ncbi:efflux RND transporter periplasmic adaptor subunit [Phaeobacter sp. 11ANDIMAR09]|uniref:efflux RND transporter periplasmic adaptor subunit n=1 Tax=Phaeobacter sp. 11ANDIMAR09 TaxID=1225647 RepID=UPI0006C83E9D|nr:efflux RND transporter periplasmic adaptor subunit [Phaeobacter sp. 11ANDIMAR09]KPD12865.1 RND transporter [Phaeobacter sp. 11ANDIMAR09]
MPNKTLETSTTATRRWVFIVFAVVMLAAVLIVLSETEDTVDVARSDVPPPAQMVSVLAVEKARTAARISVFAELRPQWNAEIRAAVSGRILTVHEGALAGTRVVAGTPLFEIERSQYETARAAAEMALEEALLARLRAQNNVTVARKQFQRDGTEPPNDLALRLPDLRIAERSVASARAQLTAARQQLADTSVTAPFSGFVTQRTASLGQTVSVGEALLTLSDDSQFELMAELSQEDWSLLEHPIAGGQAELFHRDGRPLGLADIRQGGGFLDPQTRQMRVYLEVSNPAQGVLGGDFLRVTFMGREIADTLTLPETTLTRAGHIWLVDGEDQLLRHTPKVLFRSDGKITIAAPDLVNFSGPWRVAKTPLASFLPGQRVAPELAED